jgi:hypothetical protein
VRLEEIRGKMRYSDIHGRGKHFLMMCAFSASPFFLTLFEGQCFAQSPDDGPHVFWQNDTTANVLYLCGDSLLTETHYTQDTLRFDGLCGDSDWTYRIPITSPEADTQTVFGDVSRVFTLSDIHGQYDFFLKILQAAGVVDSDGHWLWGDGHLVINGDVFDRGPKVTECLWLIYRLEQEAQSVGGALHFLLGNHELMVLRGDLRYVNDVYSDGICRKTRISYDDMYGPNSEIGRWLRTKPTAVVINGTLYVHGGISPALVERGFTLADINSAMREKLDINSAQLAFDSTARLLFGSLGPLWYRGYHYGIEGRYEAATIAQIDSILAYYGAGNVVVGHSEVEGGIQALDSGRVIAVDVDMETLGSFEGLLWQGGQFLRVAGDGTRHPLEPAKE